MLIFQFSVGAKPTDSTVQSTSNMSPHTSARARHGGRYGDVDAATVSPTPTTSVIDEATVRFLGFQQNVYEKKQMDYSDVPLDDSASANDSALSQEDVLAPGQGDVLAPGQEGELATAQSGESIESREVRL